MQDRKGDERRVFLTICSIFILIHGAFFLFDASDPTAFLRGDRAVDRFQKITRLLATDSNSFIESVLNAGVPGDFLPQALFYVIGGQYVLIAVQIFLQLCILILTIHAAFRLTENPGIAFVTGLLLVLMPGTLMDPHLLVTETWFTTFLTFGVMLICFAITSKRELGSPLALYIGFVSFALASSVRPQGLLVPAAVAVCLLAILVRNRQDAVFGAVLSYVLFPFSWMVLRLLLVGDFSLGNSDADMGTNLALRANRILSLPIDLNEPIGRLGLLDFLKIAAAHPSATMKTLYSDTVNLILNPGANHVFGYYLRVFDANPDRLAWFRTKDESGLLGILTELSRQSATFMALFAAWAIIHLTVLLGACIATVRAVRDPRRAPFWTWLILTVIVTITASAFAAGLTRWNLRAGIEPALALLAAWGLVGQFQPRWGYYSSSTGRRG